MRKLLTLCCFALLFGCGGGGGSPPAPATLGQGSFWAVDFTNNDSPYVVNAAKVAEGAYCYIYLENGETVPQATITAIANQFDTVVYPADTAAFGSEPNPGIDLDPKIYILLLNVRDGFTSGSTSFVAGYFDPTNEYALSSQNPGSNQKEILYLNVNPATHFVPGSIDFYATMAHEFQHLIHWEQKTDQQKVLDDTWLDEAMAQVARTYCGYGPDYASVYDYEQDPNHSLTSFDETVGNYGMVYLWAQYLQEQFDKAATAKTTHTIFWEMLHNPGTGIAEVNAALSAAGSTRDFTASFRDWAVANYSGNKFSWAGHPEWSYVSLTTWPGFQSYNSGQDSVTLPGLFPPSRQNLASLPALSQCTLGYYSYTPANGATTGTVTWNNSAATTVASFVNSNKAPASVFYNMTSGKSYPFTTVGYLIYANPSLSANAFPAPISHTAIVPVVASESANEAVNPVPVVPRTASEALAAMNASPVMRRFVQEAGKPHRAHIDSYLRMKEEALRAQGIRPPF